MRYKQATEPIPRLRRPLIGFGTAPTLRPSVPSGAARSGEIFLNESGAHWSATMVVAFFNVA